jgi:AcrR family transcriptional regulator
MKNLTDKRVVRTKKAIRSAFAALYSRMPFEDITVKEIARQADINRKTFYNYYAGVHSIVEEIESELTGSLESALDTVNIIAEPEAALARFNAEIRENVEFFGNIFSSRKNYEHTTRLLFSFALKLRDCLPDNSDFSPETLELVTDYVTAGVISVYRRWFISQTRRPLEDVAADLAAVMRGGLKEFDK